MKTKLIAGALLLLTITIAMTASASAQVAIPNDSVKPAKGKAVDIVKGEGAITDSSGNLFQGHYRLALVSTGNSTNEHYIVKRGQFIISDKDTRLAFKVDSSTWTFTDSANGYSANGNVKDEQGNTYKVTLDAQMVSKFKNGCIYYASGTFTDSNGNQAYQLHYVSVMVEKPKTTTST